MLRTRVLSNLLVALAALAAVAHPASAALFIVDTTALDAGDLVPGNGKCEWSTIVPAGQRCTLRAAVQEANALAGADVIIIPDGWHIVLSQSGSDDSSPNAGIGDLDILGSVAIGGFLPPPDQRPLIDGAGTAQPVFEVHAPATLTLSNVQVTNNKPIGAGAGVIVHTGAAGNFSDCRFHGNNGNGGAVRNRGTTTITRCAIEANGFSGGAALDNRGTLTVRDSLVASNSYPSAIWNRDHALLRLFNTTVVGNSGDGIYSTDDLVLENVTIMANANKGLRHTQALAFASPRIVNSILAHNAGGDCFITLPGGAPDTAHPNLDSDGSCDFLPAFGGLPGTDPLLGPLQPAGGATKVFVPTVGSPVIDAGSNANCAANDQRGAPRPLDGDGAASTDCDLGAVEVLPCDTELPNGTLSNLVVSPPGGSVTACFTMEVGPAVDVLDGAILGLFTRDRVAFRNGFSIQQGGELAVVFNHNSGSSVIIP